MTDLVTDFMSLLKSKNKTGSHVPMAGEGNLQFSCEEFESLTTHTYKFHSTNKRYFVMNKQKKSFVAFLGIYSYIT